MQLFASCAQGTETALRDELFELRFEGVRAARGGVHFTGSRREAARACLWSRVAMRVLEPVAEFECDSEDALYAGVAEIDLSEVLTPRHTLSVSAACRTSRLTHTQYIAQRTKDAIVDRQRESQGARSDVDRKDPDVHVFVHLVRDRATLYLDHAGAPLHLRGYRVAAGEAPLKETLAAAVLRLSGFDPELGVLDPMCGSGTFLIEAALWAAGRAPGILRERFGFERWASYDASEQQAMRELREGAKGDPARAQAPCLGSDVDPEVLEIAAKNAARAGVRVELSKLSIAEARPAFAAGLMLANPPYGERLDADRELPRKLARLIDRFPDHRVGILLSEDQGLGRTRRKPHLFSLFNGDLPCTLRTYQPIARKE